MPHIRGHNVNPFAGFVPIPPPMIPQRFPMAGEYPGELIYGNIAPTTTTPLPQYMGKLLPPGIPPILANDPQGLAEQQRIAAGLPATTQPTGKLSALENLLSVAKTMTPRAIDLGSATSKIFSPTGIGEQVYDLFKTYTDPEATTKEKWVAPFMPALDLALAGEEAAWKPFYTQYGGSTIGNIPGIYEGENFRSIKKRYLDQGLNSIEANEKAWEELDLHEVNNPLHGFTEKQIAKLPGSASFLNYLNPETFGWKGATEILFDPLIMTGFGKASKVARPTLRNLARKGKDAPIDNRTLRAADKPSTYFPDMPKEQPIKPLSAADKPSTYFPEKRATTFFEDVAPRTPTAPLRRAEQYFPDTPGKPTPGKPTPLKKVPNRVYDELTEQIEVKQAKLKALSLEQSKRYSGDLLDDKGIDAVDSIDLEIGQLQKEINSLKQQQAATPRDTFFEPRTDVPIDPQWRAGQYFPDESGIKSSTPSSPTSFFTEPSPREAIEPLGRDVESYFPQRQLLEDLKKTKPSQQKPRIPREGILDDAIRPGELQGSQFKPVPGTKVVKPSEAAKPFLGTGNMASGIVVDVTGKFDKLRNWLGGILGDNIIPKIGRLGIPTATVAEAKPGIQKIFKWAEDVMQRGRSKGRSFKDQYVSRIDDLSKAEGTDIYWHEAVAESGERVRTPLFRHLTGIDETLRNVDDVAIAPAIEDIAARYPKYVNNLTAEERKFFDWARKELQPYNDYMMKQGYLEKGIRPDILDGGFYMPRGGETQAINLGVDAFAKYDMPVPKRIRPKGLGEAQLPTESIIFNSKAQGVLYDKGTTRYVYMNTGDAVSDYIEAIHRLEANSVRAKGLENFRIKGMRIGQTYHTYLMDNFNKGVFPKDVEMAINKMRRAKRDLINLSRLSDAIDARLLRKVDDVLQNPFTESSNVAAVIDDIKKALKKASEVQRGKYVGANKAAITKLVKQISKDIDNLRPEYNAAIKHVKDLHQRTGQNIMELPGLSGHVWIDDMAKEMRKIIKNDPTLKLSTEDFNATIKAANALGRGTGATLDNSAPWITLLLGWANNPKAWARAAGASLQSWINPNVMGNRLKSIDKRLQNDYGINLNDLYNNGLHHSGGAMEFSIGQEGTTWFARRGQQMQRARIPKMIPGIGGAKPFEAANRAFSNAGDIMRLEMMLTELQINKVTKLNVKQFMSSGNMEDIATSINRVTGYSSKPFAGSLGEWVLFAPRYFTTRIENLTMGILSTGKGFVPGVQLSLQERLQRATLLKFIGYGTGLTFSANYLMGQETDFKPVREMTEYKTETRNGIEVKVAKKKWVWNSNFMTVRVGKRDYNVFGSSLQIVRFFATLTMAAAQKDPKGFFTSMRGISSPIVARLYDLVTLETFEGKPVDPLGLGDRDVPIQESIINFMETFMPFALQDMGTNVLEANQKSEQEGIIQGVVTGLQNVAGDFMSVPNSPMSIGDLLQDVAKLNFNKDYYDLQSWQKDIVRQLMEGEMTPFHEEAKERVNEGSKHFEAINAINKERLDKLIEIANDKRISPYQFYQRYKDIEDETRVQKQAIAIEFEETGEGINDEDPNIRALARYYTLREKSQTPAGNTDWDMYRLLKTKFMQSATKEQQDYILKNTNRSPIPYEVVQRLGLTTQGRRDWQEIKQSHILRQNELKGNPELLRILDDIFYGNTLRKE